VDLRQVPASDAAALVYTLEISHNKIEVLDSECLKPYIYLTSLLLIDSKLKQIDPDAFHSLKHLEFTDLSSNELAYVRNDLFTQNPNLKNLSLSNNPLTMLHENAPILISSSLLHIDLNSCKLSELSPSSLSQLPNLQTLDISNNHLHALSPDILRPLLKLNDINMSKNPWQCDAEFERLVCWTYNINLRQRYMKCYAGNDNKITYNYHDQGVLCGAPSTASASYTPSTIIQPAPVDVSSETATRTSVNSFHERTTVLVTSSEVITTQNDAMTQKSSTGGKSRHTDQPHSTLVPGKRTSERRENHYEVYARSMVAQPSRAKNREENDKEGDCHCGKQDIAQGIIYVQIAVLVYVIIITVICAYSVSREERLKCRRQRDRYNEPLHEKQNFLS
jgi:hypothetical protein